VIYKEFGFGNLQSGLNLVQYVESLDTNKNRLIGRFFSKVGQCNLERQSQKYTPIDIHQPRCMCLFNKPAQIRTTDRPECQKEVLTQSEVGLDRFQIFKGQRATDKLPRLEFQKAKDLF
jgi:hypothetical protein